MSAMLSECAAIPRRAILGKRASLPTIARKVQEVRWDGAWDGT
jgi:hypothetical protein